MFQKVYLNTLQSRNVGVKSVGANVDIWEKCTLSFLHEEFIIYQATNRGGGFRLDLGGEGAMAVLFCKKLPQL